MSDARWCNYGNHAFDGARGDMIMLGKMTQVPNQWGGQQPNYVPNVREICGDCAAELGITNDYQAPASPADRKAELMKELAELDKKK